MGKSRILLIGPLPPPWGGARVSFNVFYNYLMGRGDVDVEHYDYPIHVFRKDYREEVRPLRKSLWLLFCIFRIPFARRIVVFGSKNFGFSYGILLLLLSKFFGKEFYIRFFGGHPGRCAFLKIPVLGKILLRLLGFSNKIFIQTQVGVMDFPDYLRPKISVFVGYRTPSPVPVSLRKSVGAKIKFVYTGGISKEKGVPLILDAFKTVRHRVLNFRDVELHIYGVGADHIVEQIQKADGVFYHGKVENTQLRMELPNYDVFLFPTMYSNEGHPGSVIEALLAGLPVISTNPASLLEVVKDGVNGLVISSVDNLELVDCMIQIIEDDTLRFDLSKGALKTSSEFLTDNVLPKLAAAMKIV